ncbi:MAG: acyl--CoA ligase, partial [Chloroflexia bacterium]|nr:acyl--CoA ligase [Chloroflexia bacterium]
MALAFGGNQCSFADLRRNTHAAVAVLTRAGGNRGGRLGILSTNRPGFVFAIHAATSMNVPFVPLNWRQTADEIAWQLQDAGITVLVVDEERASVAAAAAGSVPVEIVPIARLERAGDQSGSRYLC